MSKFIVIGCENMYDTLHLLIETWPALLVALIIIVLCTVCKSKLKQFARKAAKRKADGHYKQIHGLPYGFTARAGAPLRHPLFDIPVQDTPQRRYPVCRKKETDAQASVSFSSNQASLLFASSTNWVKAALSLTAISASILRLITTPAFFSPLMKVE